MIALGFSCLPQLQDNKVYFTSSLNKLSSSINPSNSSHTTTSPTPAGVPVKTRSPMFTEKNNEMKETILSKLWTIRLELPCCTSSLFLYKQKLMSFLFLILLKGIHLPMAAELSQDFALSQGRPFSFNSFCRSRAVKSIPAVTAS